VIYIPEISVLAGGLLQDAGNRHYTDMIAARLKQRCPSARIVHEMIEVEVAAALLACSHLAEQALHTQACSETQMCKTHDVSTQR